MNETERDRWHRLTNAAMKHVTHQIESGSGNYEQRRGEFERLTEIALALVHGRDLSAGEVRLLDEYDPS